MADVNIIASSTVIQRAGRLIVYTDGHTGYVFAGAAGGTFIYRKTTDGGATWAAAVTIATATTHVAFDVWFDQWTPGDTGTLIHMWYFDTTNDAVRWRSLDTNGDSLGTERTVLTGASAVAGRGAFVSGTKTVSGYLYAAYDIDAGAETGFRRSTDSGTTWSADLGGSATAWVEATVDGTMLFPASGTGDNNDCWGIYHDNSANALTMKMYDSSATTVIESSTVQTTTASSTDGLGQTAYSGSVRKSDGHLIIVSCSERDTATADMQCWDVSAVNSASLTGVTAKTDITTNIDDNYYPSVFIDQDTNKIYVAYNGKRDGSETLGTTTSIYYTTSTDGGTTWSAGDTAYSQDAAAFNLQAWVPPSGHRFAAFWRTNAGAFNTGVTNAKVLFTLVTTQGSYTYTGQTIDLTYTPVSTVKAFALLGVG